MWIDVLVFSVLFIMAASPLVMTHECGHFLAARAARIKATELRIGLGPAVYKRIGRTGTAYRIGLIPIGAHCGIDEESYRQASPYWRLIFSAAGSGSNFLLAMLIIVAIAPFYQSVMPVITVADDGPAMQAGLLTGDTIVSIDGVDVQDWQDVGMQFVARMGDTGELTFDIKREDTISTHAIRIENWQSERRQIDPFGSLGMAHAHPPAYHHDSAIKRYTGAVYETFTMGFETVASGLRMLAGDLSVLNFGGGLWLSMQGEDQVNLLLSEDRQTLPWYAWVKWLALLSVGLGMINLLPGPLVDGSGVISASLAILTGKDLSERVDRALVITGSIFGFGPLMLCSYYEVMRFL